MSYNFPLGGLVTTLKNGQRAKVPVVTLKKSKLCESLLNKLMAEGYLRSVVSKAYTLEVGLIYLNNKGPLTNLSTISSPGKRVYFSLKDLWALEKDLSLYILSTPKGILTHREALAQNVGGEVLCKIS